MTKHLSFFYLRKRHSVVTVHLGRTTLIGFNPNHITRHVLQTILHPNYNSTTNNNDIALLRLHSSVTFSDYVRPVCLVGHGSSFPDNTMSWITGWGNVNSTGKMQTHIHGSMRKKINKLKVCDVFDMLVCSASIGCASGGNGAHY